MANDELRGKQVLIVGEGLPVSAIEAAFRQAGATVNFDTYVGPIDIAVLNLSTFSETPFMETTTFDWSEALRKTFEGVVLRAQALALHMIEQRVAGRIIFLSSVAALKGLRNLSITGTVLAALHSVARMAAVDLGPYGITVNVVAVGWMAEGWRPTTLDNAEALTAHIPLGRLGSLESVGELCCFLASDATAYLTGAIIPVDGGYSLTKAGAGTTRGL